MTATTSQTQPTHTYLVPEFRIEELVAKLGKLAARAAALSVPPPTWQVLPGLVMKAFSRGPGDGTYKLPCRTVVVSANRITMAGWRFCAYLEHFDEGNRIFATEELPLWCRTIKSRCEHCRTERRRTGTYIVRNEESGDYRQVGSTCLEDFLGTASAAEVASSLATLRDMHRCFDDEGDGDSWGVGSRYLSEMGADIRDVMCYCLEDISRSGFRSRKSTEGTGIPTTGDIAFRFLDEPSERKKAWPGLDHEEIVQSHLAHAEKILAFWLSYPVRTDFEHTCSLLASRGIAKGRDGNFVAAMVSAYAREISQRETAAGGKNEPVGTVGARIEVEVTVDGIIPCNSARFPSTLHLMRDQENRVLKWFASSSNQGFEPGKRYRVLLTIKKHEERKGQVCTIVNRCVVQKVIQAAA